MAPLKIRQATKSFGAQEVLHGIDVDIEDGEFVVLVGPSGCGKSTLLRLLAGLEDITTGQIEIDGRDVSRLHPKDRDIAMVFQSYALYPHMTVAENMGFSLRMRGASKDEQRTKVEEAAGVLDLGPLLDRYPRQLSGGQRQRVAMGRAIVRDPKVFLFDEPLSNLDAKLRVQMRAEIKSLHHRLQTTTVYVTHDQVEAMTMADRIVVMNGGNVEQIGTPLELYDTPANVFVAGFIGSPSMNLIEATATAEGIVDASGTLWARPDAMWAPGRKVVVGVRPEDLLLDDTGTALSVTLTEPTGAEVQVAGTIGTQSLVCLFRERVSARPGETIHISPRPGSPHIFDRETGQRLSFAQAPVAESSPKSGH